MAIKTCSKSIQSLLKQFKMWHPPPLQGKRVTTKNIAITTFGLILNADDELNWEAHVKHLKSKLYAAIVIIKRIKRYIPNLNILIFLTLYLCHIFLTA